MKAAAASAKAGNATVLAALINLFAKHSEGQVGEKAAEIFEHVQRLREANLERVDNENGSQGT